MMNLKKNKTTMKRFLCTFLFVTIYGSTFAQTDYWRENIQIPIETGYHNIEISPEIAGLGLETLRIIDEEGKEIPYFIRSSVPVKELKELDLYELKTNIAKDSVNIVTVYNKEKEKVSGFYLCMKGADVKKQISIRGSYDSKQWFTVKQASTFKNDAGAEITAISFPEGDYTFYEITVINNSGSPLNLTGVGKVKYSNIYGKFIEINTKGFTIEEDKEQKRTLISFSSMSYPYYLSKLEIAVKNKEHYKRRVQITKKGNVLDYFSLSSREENTFFFNTLLIDKDTHIEIYHQDNPPLEIESIRLFDITRYLCAYLEEGKQYHIDTQGTRYKHYDVQDFANEIPQLLPVVKTTHLISITQEPEPESERKFFEKPLFLWGAIILTGVILLLICIRMLNELKKR
ncbi:hypothetical protein [Bacteroides sp. 224]|uniref:hypothetical protein n=1 Tax=Bacteroides sp. 224 TaxID=2302936 RepID=UPI0013D4251F|nr:hypothetical protein [Bacteroides sp. 224]